jgi:hypothetical protein
MTPIRWWEYPVLAMTGLWVAIPRQQGDRRGRRRVLSSITVAVFAVGCPVCNKIVVGLLGVSGALGLWAPAQPVLVALSLAALAAAMVVRWRRRSCTPDAREVEVPDSCQPEEAPWHAAAR